MKFFNLSILIISLLPLVACTPADSKISNESIADSIRELENKRLSALVEADSITANLLHANDFQLINPSGRTYSKEQYLGGIASGHLDYTIFRPDSEIQVRVDETSAVIRYRSILEITVGEQYYPPTSFWHTDTYELRDGQWQVVWSQATTVVE
ncbi:MAG: nuclear transport factor 2 family protein [Rhodothermales bacterium]